MSHRIDGTQLSRILSVPKDEQEAAGFSHTLREIRQQPELWCATAEQIARMLGAWRALVGQSKAIVFTGSGSSCYVGECLAHPVQAATGLPVRAISSGDLLLLRNAALPPLRPLLLVSFARSGDSPESSELIRRLLDEEPEVRHLIITCNQTGRLAEIWGPHGLEPTPRVSVVTLDDRTCDRSLVMTSSFTNLALAGLGLAYLGREAEYVESAKRLACLGDQFLACGSDALADAASTGFRRVIALGDGSAFGAARESALKNLEMTDGRVFTMAETTLGFRHGPMCGLHRDALLLLFLSADPLRRPYQLDLLDEIRRKDLGGRKIVAGICLDGAALEPDDLAIEFSRSDSLGDEWAAMLFVLVGQLLAFFRCRAEGLRPDEPAANGAISRVVSDFRFHSPVYNRNR
ncbi:MAG: tagatose-6-phosphate ketose isomerase [Proteobacteria bacterium]|nr:MAG: tagatose-6-phosphate ketose isomerase [Pseudomonadota bacterium]